MGNKERMSDELELDEHRDPGEPMLPTVNPETEKPAPPRNSLHPAFYIGTWITISSTTILFNKYILSTAGFAFPIVLTSWHMIFGTLMTQIMARFTHTLDSRKNVPMNGRLYLRTIVPIGLMFSLSLICGNLTYLYLSVSFIQMLKATMPVVTLLVSWVMGVAPPSLKTLGNVSFIVLGVIIASYGEIKFVLIGFLFQCGGILFEAIRLVMVQKLLSGAEFKMDPLVSLYYFAPVCALINGTIALFIEVPKMTLADVQNVGYSVLLINAVIAFALNVSVVFLIGKTSSLVMTLSGVLKDILLVLASMFIFRDPVSGIQAFGYSVALCGLIYYKLGLTTMKEYVGHGQRRWAELGQQRPAARKVLMAILCVAVVLVLFGAASSTGSIPEGYDPAKLALEKLWAAMDTTGA